MEKKRSQYLVTHFCYWYKKKTRTAKNVWEHWIELRNIRTGKKKQLKNGSIIEIVKERK